MATDMGKLQKIKNTIWPIICKRDASEENSQGSTIVSCEIMFSRERMLENNRDDDVCRKRDDLAEEDHTYRMVRIRREYFHYKQNWWISLNKSGNTTEPMRKRFWLQPSVVYIEPFTPRSWRTTTQAHTPLEVPAMETGIEFFLHLVAMEWILVVFLRIQRKSKKEDASKGLRSNGNNPLSADLWRKPQTNGFHDFILFCCR